MEEDGDGEDLTPFWVQSSTNTRRTDRLRRRASSIFLSSGLVVLLLLVTAVIFLVFVVPSTISFSAQIFRPNSVKKSWDSLNIVLVLVAVVFGFLSRNKNEDNKYSYYDEFQASTSKQNESQKSNPSTPNKNWYNYSINEEQKSNPATANQWFGYSDYQSKLETKNSVLRRNSSSYPDLREISSSDWSYGDYQRRYYDDIHVDLGRVSDPGHLHRRHRSLEGVDHLRAPQQTKTVVVDTLLSKSKESTSLPAASPSPQPAAVPLPEVEEDRNGSAPPQPKPPQRRRKVNRDLEPLNPISAPKPPQPPVAADPPQVLENPERRNESVARRKERSGRKLNKDVESMNPSASPPQPPPASPPPPQQKSSKSERKRGGATGSATKDFLNSLYQKKKKKQRQKSVDNMDSLLHEPQAPLSFQIPPPSPPPPPPPPPPSVFQNLFSSKKQKRKRTITVRIEPHTISPPQLPLAPAEACEPEHIFHAAPLTSHKPPKPIKMNSFDKLQEISNSGGNSPLNRIPPPPPPPPPAFFKSSAWKFVVQGDYVRINSSNSSRSGSPDLDDTDSDVTPSAGDAGYVTPFHPSPLFCPSPDVNTKAESFISNFRAKLKMEKNYSMKREVGLSTLGPGPGPSLI